MIYGTRLDVQGSYHPGMAYDEALAGRVGDCLREDAGAAAASARERAMFVSTAGDLRSARR